MRAKSIQRHIDWFNSLSEGELVLLKRAWFILLKLWVRQKIGTLNRPIINSVQVTSEQLSIAQLAVTRAEKYHFIRPSEQLKVLAVDQIIKR